MEVELTWDEKDFFECLRDFTTLSGLQVTVRIAGGWVRDKIMQLSPHDMDLVYSGENLSDFPKAFFEYLKSKGEKVFGLSTIKQNL